MNERITVYHGSTLVIQKPVYGLGNHYNDYSLGFYYTQSVEFAKEWACSADTDGFVNQYLFHTKFLSVLYLTRGN